MSDLVGTQIVGFLMHRHFFRNIAVSASTFSLSTQLGEDLGTAVCDNGENDYLLPIVLHMVMANCFHDIFL